jgi:hypothetical protein
MSQGPHPEYMGRVIFPIEEDPEQFRANTMGMNPGLLVTKLEDAQLAAVLFAKHMEMGVQPFERTIANTQWTAWTPDTGNPARESPMARLRSVLNLDDEELDANVFASE